MKILHPQTLEFLQAIDDFNEKKYFELYKPLYLNIKEKYEEFIESLILEISKFDTDLEWQAVKPCIFRIYKDMRRPKNRERPYKINMGANIWVGGRKSPYAGYYLHIQNGKSFLCWGIWRPKGSNAYKIREHIYQERDIFKKIINKKRLKQICPKITTTQPLLKKPNRKSKYSKILWEIPDKHPSLKYIAMKDWILQIPLANEEVLDKKFFEQCLDYAKICFEFNNFINESF